MIAPPDSLGTAEVTAQRRVAGLATPQALQQLTATDLQQRGVTDIADALRRFSGVDLTLLNGWGSQWRRIGEECYESDAGCCYIAQPALLDADEFGI